MQRHRDQRRAAKHHVDADEQAESPGRGAGQAGENDGGQDQVDDAAHQHPCPSSRQVALVLEREHYRSNAFDREKRDEDQSERKGAAQRPQQQHDTGGNSEDRREERPPESRRRAHQEGRDQAGDSAEQENPAKQDRDRKRSDRRNGYRGETEEDENDPLDQKEFPVLVQRCRHRLPNSLDVGLVHRHGRYPRRVTGSIRIVLPTTHAPVKIASAEIGDGGTLRQTSGEAASALH